MSSSIRARLLILVLASVVPAAGAALYVIYRTVQTEREAHVRTLRETARALSLVVDRELNQRATIARVLSLSRSLDRAPEFTLIDLQLLEQQARRAMVGLEGWVELRSGGRVLLDTRRGPSPPEAAPPGTEFDPPEAPFIGRLLKAAGGPWHAQAVQPVQREGRTLATLIVTLVPAEMQRVVDSQELPRGWYGGILDPVHALVARQPGGGEFTGSPPSDSLRSHLVARADGLYEAMTPGNVPVVGYSSTSRQGWTYVVAMPLREFGGYLAAPVLQVGGSALLLLGLTMAGGLWVARGIGRPVRSLKAAAARPQAGEIVPLGSTGIRECDEVVQALSEAAETLIHNKIDLERQVADAVARTRAAEQRASHGQRVEALGRLTGGVAHDFNNLLGVISNSAHLVQRQADRAPALAAPVAAIQRAVEVGSRLTQHLLRFAGRQPVRPQTMALGRYLPEMKEMLESVAGKRISVSVEVAPDIAPVTVDSGELELALINLALNARDAMPGGGTLRVTARNAHAAEGADLGPGRYVLISVEDDGAGIDEALAERVFEPFFTTKAVGRGTGLGLAQVHGFCVQAGGQARFASAPGQGATISLLLPASAGGAGVRPAPGIEPAAGDTAAAVRAAQLEGVRVLLVEDNEDLGQVTAALLESYGCEVRRALDPAEALELIAAAPAFDLVLSDVVMPGPTDGIALARTLREQHPALPVVLISGYSAALAATRDFPVLHKPYSQEMLLAAMRDALAARARDAT